MSGPQKVAPLNNLEVTVVRAAINAALRAVLEDQQQEARPQAPAPPSEPGIRYVTLKRFTELTGYTKGAVYNKVGSGAWIAGVHYRKSPDGHVQIDLEAYARWVEGKRP